MSQSKFVLCPRGYGKTSFRIQEALQYGAIPVYISDEHLFSTGCLNVFHYDKTPRSDYSIEQMSMLLNSVTSIQELNKEYFNRYYTYEAVANRIYENLL